MRWKLPIIRERSTCVGYCWLTSAAMMGRKWSGCSIVCDVALDLHGVFMIAGDWVATPHISVSLSTTYPFVDCLHACRSFHRECGNESSPCKGISWPSWSIHGQAWGLGPYVVGAAGASPQWQDCIWDGGTPIPLWRLYIAMLIYLHVCRCFVPWYFLGTFALPAATGLHSTF